MSRKLTAEEVATVFIRRARALGGAADGGVNALTDELYDAALKRAREIDASLAAGEFEEPARAPVLLGVPLSVKDHIDVAGRDSTTGCAAKCFKPRAKDALIVELLRVRAFLCFFRPLRDVGRLIDEIDESCLSLTLTGTHTSHLRTRHMPLPQDAGAVIHCKSNVPQMLMLPETHNHVFGTTTNPWDSRRCAGGSSGGEGALVGARASPLGIGTDIGGSIRIPAAFNGVAGFKPTPWRVSDQGLTQPFLAEDRTGMQVTSQPYTQGCMHGDNEHAPLRHLKPRCGQAIKLCAGPIARDVEDLVLMLKAWWVPKMWERDPFVVPLPFDDAAWRVGRGKGQTIRLGYFTTDGW